MKKQLLVALAAMGFAANVSATDILKNVSVKNTSDYVIFIAWTYKAKGLFKYKSDYERILPGATKDFSLRFLPEMAQIELGGKIGKDGVKAYKKRVDAERIKIEGKRADISVDSAGKVTVTEG